MYYIIHRRFYSYYRALSFMNDFSAISIQHHVLLFMDDLNVIIIQY